MKRRHFIATSALAAGASLAGSPLATPPRKLGLSIASYMLRGRQSGPDTPKPGWQSALDVLDHCHELGAGCLQTGVRGWTADFAGKVREKRESLGIALEGQIGLPWKESDAAKFESDLLAAKEAGASILRTVCLSGRRYENFDSLEKWNKFVIDSKQALERAEPIVGKHGVKLAFENHKDWRIEEQLILLNHLGSEFIGVNYDFGNNLALLEDPVSAAEALAPFIMSTHIKDMAVAEYGEGFLLSEVPLGQGIVDVSRIMQICAEANPAVWFNLEMITRDPLKVPVFQDKYWETMADLPAPDLARTLRLAKAGDPGKLPKMTGRDNAGQIAFEEANIRESFDYARKKLGFG